LSGVLAYENALLLRQGRKLKAEVIPRPEERAEPSNGSREKPGHRKSLQDGFNPNATARKLLILRNRLI
jgi:hypothetical protein